MKDGILKCFYFLIANGVFLCVFEGGCPHGWGLAVVRFTKGSSKPKPAINLVNDTESRASPEVLIHWTGRGIANAHFIVFHYFTYFWCLALQHRQYMEVPRLAVESELQLPAYTTASATGDPS